MNTIGFSENTRRDLSSRAREDLSNLKISDYPKPDSIIRLRWDCKGCCIFSWLHNQKTNQKTYWSNRENSFEYGGIGVCFGYASGASNRDRNEHLATLMERLRTDSPGVRYFGGFAFDDNPQIQPWADQPKFEFHVPRFELFRENQQYSFAVNFTQNEIQTGQTDAIIYQIDQINFEKTTVYRPAPHVLARTDIPNKQQWLSNIKSILGNISQKHLKKAVLARESRFDFDKAIDPIALLAHLKPLTAHSFHYAFQTNHYQGFLGATPERLLKWEGDRFETEALAGSTPRSTDDADDHLLAQNLVKSQKNALEHQLVVEHIRDVLLPRCDELNYDTSFSLLRLQKTQHLISRFSGIKESAISWDALINALHPTPAVGGVPTEDALTAIQKLESFSRGWYAGGLGWIADGKGELCVGIRCGRVLQDKLYLYAGAGIVEGSVPEEEWDEIENKIANFIKVFYQ